MKRAGQMKIEIDLSDELDQALEPWTCPECRRVYLPPLTIYVSPVDGKERCADCANSTARGASSSG